MQLFLRNPLNIMVIFKEKYVKLYWKEKMFHLKNSVEIYWTIIVERFVAPFQEVKR